MLDRPGSPALQDLPGAGVEALPEGPLLVALSGGPDSTALLLWLWSRRLDLIAAHFDHALRPESAAESRTVRAFCDGIGVRCVVARRDSPMPGSGSRQAAARELRLAFLERAAEEAGAGGIAIAHTADDVVEGVLLHLLRGASLPGLRGMPSHRGRIVRPLRATWHADVEAYLRRLGVEPLRDPSNEDAEHYARARVRTRLLPALCALRPGLDRRLWRIADRAQAWTDRLEASARTCGPTLPALADAVVAVRFEVYRQVHGGMPALGRRHLEAIDRLVLQGRTGDGLDLPAGRLWRDRDALRLERRAPATGATGAPGPRAPALRVRWCPGCAATLAEAVHLPDSGSAPALRLASRAPGMRLRPAGGRGTRKLQDLLVDADIPRRRRSTLPLLLGDRPAPSGRPLLWVPGVARDASLTIPSDRPGWHVTLNGEALNAAERARGKEKPGW
ncbi:MAG: tRNA lysidine(34) synthetase TilS [Candidatus Dormibacteraceae bacterium]